MTNEEIIRAARDHNAQTLADLSQYGPVGSYIDQVVMWRRAVALSEELAWYLDRLAEKRRPG